MPDISLFGLGKPANTLVEKVSNAFGRHFDPSQTVRMAEAEARAHHILAVNKAETAIEVADLRRRAGARVINEEMTNQINIETITEKATHFLNEDAKPEDMDDDWVRNCIDKCKMVSDPSMQDLWARILSGEANSPGSFSRRTVNLMTDLDKNDAKMFERLCKFVWESGPDPWLMVFDTLHEIYNSQGINFSTLVHLESLGLVRFDELNGFVFKGINGKTGFSYFNQLVVLENKTDSEKDLNLGKALFTQAGRELFQVANKAPVEGFYEYVRNKWADESLISAISP